MDKKSLAQNSAEWESFHEYRTARLKLKESLNKVDEKNIEEEATTNDN